MTGEKRRQSRAALEIRVEYRTVGSFLSDYVVNISRGGLFIRTDHPLKIGSSVRLVFSLPGMPFPFDLSGEVKRIQDGQRSTPADVPGMGIEFVHLDERIQKRIEAYVKKHTEEVPESIRESQAEPPKVSFRRLSGSDQRSEATQYHSGPSHRRKPDPAGGEK